MSDETTTETFECSDCHMHYRSKELADACKAACDKGMCDSEITAQSIERTESPKDDVAAGLDPAQEEPVLTEGDYEGKWKRALADYQNLTKEMSIERVRMRKNVVRDVVEALLPILDNFASATAQEPETEDAKVKNWVMGVGHIRKQMEDMLAEFGVTAIATKGKSFDAKLMEAVGEESVSADGGGQVLEPVPASGSVLRETSPGYVMGDTIIRPAKVITVK